MNTEVEQEIARFNEVMRLEGNDLRASLWMYGQGHWIAVIDKQRFVEYPAPTNAADTRLRLKDLRGRFSRDGAGVRPFCGGACTICSLIRGSIR